MPPSERPPITARSMPRWPSSPRMSADGERLGVLRGIGRALRLAVAAHVPGDEPVARLEHRALRRPHAAGRRVPVAQEHRGPVSAVLVVDLDAVDARSGHGCLLIRMGSAPDYTPRPRARATPNAHSFTGGSSMDAVKDASHLYDVERRGPPRGAAGLSHLRAPDLPTQQVPWHSHSQIRDTFYVLEGHPPGLPPRSQGGRAPGPGRDLRRPTPAGRIS